jgi:hypothetical protein
MAVNLVILLVEAGFMAVESDYHLNKNSSLPKFVLLSHALRSDQFAHEYTLCKQLTSFRTD